MKKRRSKKTDNKGIQSTNVVNGAFADKKRGNSYFDYSLLFACIFVTLLGFVLLYSASSYSASRTYNDSLYFFKRQIFATGLGIVAFIVVMIVSYSNIRRFSWLIYLLALISVVMVKTPLGVSLNGASRWLKIGPIQFQPAELVKIAVILVTAHEIAKCGVTALGNYKNCWKILIRTTIIPVFFIMVCTSNLSSSIIILLIGYLMIIIAGATKKFLFQSIGLGAILALLAWPILNVIGGGFRGERIQVWLDPASHYNKLGYQVMQGLYAIGSGGLFGKGLGNSTQKIYLPEATNDMIFSIVVEEFGVFGAVCIVALFIFILFRMKTIATYVPGDMFGSMIVVGVMLQIGLQFILNIAVVTNTIPNTGVSLPFISYGGTSLAFLIAELGLVFSVSKSIGRA